MRRRTFILASTGLLARLSWIAESAAESTGDAGPLNIGALLCTSTDEEMHPTFELSDVSHPEVGDTLTLYINGAPYERSITYSHLYDLCTMFPELPELLNATHIAQVRYARGSNSVYSNQIRFSISVPYSRPKLATAPTIELDNNGFGDTFTVTPSAFTGRPVATSTYQWKRDGASISGATGPTYDRTTADNGKTITCTQTATNSEGSDTDTSTGVYVPVPGYAHLGMASEAGGYGGSHAKTVSFGTYTGTKTALIMCHSGYGGANISTLAISGHTVTKLTIAGGDSTRGAWTVPIVDGGSRTLTFSGSAGPGDLLMTWGLLGDGIDPVPATALQDSGSGTGQTQLTIMPSTTVLTDGVQIALTRFCLDTGDNGEGTPAFENATREGYASLGNAINHVCSSSFNLRMKQNRANGNGAWSYIGLIFDPV